MLFLILFLMFNFTIYSNFDMTYDNHNKSLYLDLMKKCLINSIYQDPGCTYKNIHNFNYQKEIREKGLDWPYVAHTMIGLHRLNNLQFCIEDVLAHNVLGDFIETGVWRGGATIFMRAILKAYNITDRKVFAADSFAGLPKSNATIYSADKNYDFTQYEMLAVSLEQVQSNFKVYDLLDDQVVFLKGWFKDTLPNAPIQKLAILRLDGDLYESTMDALVNLYPKLSIGGYIIIDDYFIPCCNQAVHDYREKFNITDDICSIPNDPGVYWKRTK